MVRIAARKVRSGARRPQYATAGAAGLDLHACLETPMEIASGGIVLVPTGMAFAIPSGYVGLIRDRSSLALSGLHTVAGVIDSDYRGEVLVAVHNAGSEPRCVRPHDRIAQMLVLPCPQVEVVEMDELPPSERGAGGFGSTGR
ncbi:MAG: dUTP diphosphatase [Sphingomonadaceae bacterium]